MEYNQQMENSHFNWKVYKAKGMTFKRVETAYHIKEEELPVDTPYGDIRVIRTSFYSNLPENTIENILIYLNTNPKYAGKIKWNISAKKYVFDGHQFNSKLAFYKCVISDIIYDVEWEMGFYAPGKVKRAIDILTKMPENQIIGVEETEE